MLLKFPSRRKLYPKEEIFSRKDCDTVATTVTRHAKYRNEGKRKKKKRRASLSDRNGNTERLGGSHNVDGINQ